MKKQYAVLGLGRFGSKVARELYYKNYEVIVVDKDENKIQNIKDEVTHAYIGDISDEASLKEAGVPDVDVVIIGESSHIESNIIASQLCKTFGIKQIVAKAQNTLHGKILEKIGVDMIVFPEQDVAIKLVNRLTSGKIVDYLDLGESLSIVGIKSLDKFVGRSIDEIQLRKKYNITILAIRRGEETVVVPTPETIIERGDVMIVFGEEDSLKKLDLDVGHRT